MCLLLFSTLGVSRLYFKLGFPPLMESRLAGFPCMCVFYVCSRKGVCSNHRTAHLSSHWITNWCFSQFYWSCKKLHTEKWQRWVFLLWRRNVSLRMIEGVFTTLRDPITLRKDTEGFTIALCRLCNSNKLTTLLGNEESQILFFDVSGFIVQVFSSSL